MSFLCSIGFHKLHPAKITLSQEHYAATGTYLRQCLRCGCILERKDKPTAGVSVPPVRASDEMP